jgi:hypothetical protein
VGALATRYCILAQPSNISYATYVKDPYAGFSSDSPRNASADLKRFPSFVARLAIYGGTPQYSRLFCTGMSPQSNTMSTRAAFCLVMLSATCRRKTALNQF